MQNQTVPPPSGAGRAPGATEQGPGHSRAADRPVFVDPSGRRQRRVRRLGRLLAIPAAAYVALLLSTALGGPSVNSPYLPLPAAGDHRTGPAGPGAGDRTPATSPKGSSPAAGSHAARPTAGSGTGGASPRPSAAGTASPSAHPTAKGSAKPSATAVPTVTHGKSQVTHPAPTHTGRGHG
ncbi:hypothetical protein [Streptomyces sp. NPDC020917]|uniref:hypothetical protein n=1 Tax=Streptomyces sp. NPDC020917 TaxID=3365102 RepID=UPI0037B768AC